MSNLGRTEKILARLKDNGSASVEELAAALYVSNATIRRDLSDLESTGQIKRTHGGALYAEKSDEISIFIRQMKNAKEKEKVASIALKHMPEFNSVFLDNSSTCLALAARMNMSNKTVITNGLHIATQTAKQSDVNVIIPGGRISPNTSAVLGAMATNTLNDFNFDVCIISCSAIDEHGTYEFTLDSMQIKTIALERAKTRILIVDSKKFGTQAGFRTARLSDFDYIFTDADNSLISKITPSNVPITVFNS